MELRPATPIAAVDSAITVLASCAAATAESEVRRSDATRTPALLRTAFVALGDHRDRPDLRDVGDFLTGGAGAAAGEDEERLPILAAEGRRDHAARRRDDAEVLAGLVDHLDAGAARDVQAAHPVDRAAVAAARRELHELALVRQRAVLLH